MNPPPERRIACPRCGAATVFGPSNRWRPFCGERCSGIDLGAWASEAYRVPTDPSPGDAVDTPPADSPRH
jgi:endogenous inhibitor of DNA gyrase (YacG/DUF329 family)